MRGQGLSQVYSYPIKINPYCKLLNEKNHIRFSYFGPVCHHSASGLEKSISECETQQIGYQIMENVIKIFLILH